MSNFESSLIH